MSRRDDDYDDDRPRRRDDHDDDYDRPPAPSGRSGGNTAVGVINIVLGSLITLAGLGWILCGVVFAGAAADVNQFNQQFGGGQFGGQQAARGVGMVAGVIIVLAVLTLLIGIGMIMAGVGILNRRSWARILTLVFGGLAIVATLFGIWTLLQAFQIPAGFPGRGTAILTPLIGILIYTTYSILVFVTLLNSRNAAEFR